MTAVEYHLELCDVSAEHRPVALFRACSPFTPVAVGERFDDEGWPRLEPGDAPGRPDAPRRYIVHSIKHVVTQQGDKIIDRYCLNLEPFEGDRSPVWGAHEPVATPSDR